MAGGVSALLGLARGGEQAAHQVEGFQVSDGVGAGGAADGRLVHHDRQRDSLGTLDGAAGQARSGIERFRRVHGVHAAGRFLAADLRRFVERFEGLEHHLVHQGGFPGTGNARDRHHHAERDLDVEVLEVVKRRTGEPYHALGIHGAGGARRRHLQFARQVARGERGGAAGQQFLHGTLEDDLAAVFAGAGPQIDDVIGGAHDFRVVLDHHDGISDLAQFLEDADQPPGVARVQPDGGLVEHVASPHQARPQAGGQLDALRFAARKGG